MANLISARGLEKSYGARTLFSELSFGLGENEKVGLVGPNGAGKSTLLRILTKSEEPDRGDVVWTRGLKVALLPQTPQFQFATITEELGRNNLQVRAQVEELFHRLDGDELNDDFEISSLSGGQKKKVALVRELLKKPDLLFLDEPTNHLDIESILKLEEFLQEQRSLALLVVTHDRLFLQNVASVIMDLDPRYKEGILKTDGSYADYLESRELRLSGQLSQESARANDLRREMAWLRRGAKARQTKQKARQEQAYALMDEVKELRSLNHRRKLDLQISSGGFAAQKLIEADKISKTFGDKILFKDFSILIRAKSRIALLGKNGRGKSTLIRCLLQQLPVDTGIVKLADKLTSNYFEQDRGLLDANRSLLENICPQGDYVHLHGQPVFVKSYLDRFRFRREQHDLLVRNLSGGEQARLLLAKMMLLTAPVLVLDEPTNDLDIETLDVLRDALVSFEGALILVTHDRFFMEQVCDTLIAFPEAEDLLVGDTPGTLFRFESYLQWQNWKLERRELYAAKELEALGASGNSGNFKAGRSPGKSKLSFKEKFELENMEGTILAAEEQLAETEQALGRIETQSNPTRLRELSGTLNDLQDRVSELYERWAELTKKNS